MGVRKIKVNGVWVKTPEYRLWAHIKDRCFNPNTWSYKYYGGRGITMCQEWQDDFESFLSHIGFKPGPEFSLDRINNDGNYEPGNVRWATWKQQSKNRRMENVGGHNKKINKGVLV